MTKSMPKWIELTSSSKCTETGQPTNMHKINLNKIVRDEIKLKK